jgi:hypothetical protein
VCLRLRLCIDGACRPPTKHALICGLSAGMHAGRSAEEMNAFDALSCKYIVMYMFIPCSMTVGVGV